MNAVTLADSINERSLIGIPKHIAIIMDGNRRWAKENLLPYNMGHWKGAETLSKIVRSAAELGVKVLTVYAFSTENWARSNEEVDSLMELFEHYLTHQKETMIKEGVKLDAIGDLTRFSCKTRKVLEETIEATKEGSTIELVLALNYGGRDDIRRAFASLMDDVERGQIGKDEITEETISSYLDTAKWPDPNLLIRTSGEQRISNFLIWQISYAEMYVTKVHWPEFDEEELMKAIMEYQRRERRLGV